MRHLGRQLELLETGRHDAALQTCDRIQGESALRRGTMSEAEVEDLVERAIRDCRSACELSVQR